MTFDSIKSDVENTYPMPLARVARKYRITPEEDLGGRHKELIDVFELLIKFLCVVQLQEARQHISGFRHHLPQGEKTLQFLRHPSLGGWGSLLRTLCHLELEQNDLFWFQQISRWYRQGKHVENTEILRLFEQIGGTRYESRSRHPHAEICNAFVNYRNKQLAHTASLSEQEMLKRLPLLEHILAYLLHSIDFLKTMQPMYTDRIELNPDDSWRVHTIGLRGINEEPSVFNCPHKLELSEIYLLSGDSDENDRAPVHLGPFFLRQLNEQSRSPEIYVYNDAWRTKLEYISYESGAYYYHKELHSDFQELLNIKLRPGVDEDAYRFLSPEERAQRAEDAFKRGLMFVEKAQYENALEFFELSAELERRPATLLEMAKTQKVLGEPQDAILQNLQHCLELDPANREGLALQQEFSQHDAHTAKAFEAEEIPGGPDFLFTLFHLMCPKALQAYAELFWIALLLLWYTFSAASEYLAGDASKMLLNLLQCSLGTLIILCVATGKRLFLRLRIPLSFQLDSMRLERFERWLQEQAYFIFGHIREDKMRIIYHYAESDEKIFNMLSVLIIIPAGIIGYIMCELYDAPLVFMLKRWLDNMIVVILLGLVIFRYIFASSIFIYRFSKLSLKPMLSKLSDDGFRAFSPFIVSNLSFVIAGFLSYLALAYAEFSHPLPLDLLFLAAGIIFYIAWSFGMPITLRISARQAKSNSILRYLQHIETAFNEFLDEPDEEKLKTYSWLLDQQKVLQAIPTWPLSWKATLFAVIGSNLIMLSAAAWYSLVRLGQWAAFLEWLAQKF